MSIRTYVVGSDGSSRVARNKLELHINLAKQKLILRLKSRARGLVKRESEKAAIVKYFGAAIAPSDIKILVEVPSISNRHCREQKYR